MCACTVANGIQTVGLKSNSRTHRGAGRIGARGALQECQGRPCVASLKLQQPPCLQHVHMQTHHSRLSNRATARRMMEGVW